MATMSLPNVLSRLGRGGLLGDLHVQVLELFTDRHLSQGVSVHGVDERLHVRVEDLWRLRLGADGRHIQKVAANHRRQELVGEHPLRVARVERVGQVAGRAEDVGLGGWDGVAEVRVTRLALKPESESGLRAILVIGGLALPAGKAWTTPCFPRSRASPCRRDGVDEVGVALGEDLGDEDRVVGDVAGAPIRDRNSGGIASNLHGPVEDRVERIAARDDEDGYGALGMVRHIEQGAVRVKQPRGSVPTRICCTSLPSTRSTTETVPLMPLVTYAAWSVGWTATQRGSWPTPISASFMETSLPLASFT